MLYLTFGYKTSRYALTSGSGSGSNNDVVMDLVCNDKEIDNDNKNGIKR